MVNIINLTFENVIKPRSCCHFGIVMHVHSEFSFVIAPTDSDPCSFWKKQRELRGMKCSLLLSSPLYSSVENSKNIFTIYIFYVFSEKRCVMCSVFYRARNSAESFYKIFNYTTI